MKAISRALADAARQLASASDTARLDSELLMAEALNIDRDRLLRRNGFTPGWDLVAAAAVVARTPAAPVP